VSGARGTLSALDLPPAEAIAFFRGKVNTPTERWTDLWEGAHARAWSVAGATSDALLGDIRGEVMKALEQGTTLAEFRRAFTGLVEKHGWAHTGTPGWRAQIILETNLSMAYSAGRYAQMVEPETLAIFPFWQYVHSGARNPREQHRGWNGKVLRADDGWWRTHYPPNGWNCGCRVRPLSARDLRRQGLDGPEPTPRVVMRQVNVPGRGQVSVPDGIDAGFAYNVGEGFAGMPKPPGWTRWQPPEGWAPPAPAPASPAPRPARPPASADALTTVFVPDGPPPRAQAAAVARVVRRPRPPPEVLAQDSELRLAYRPWATSLTPDERAAVRDYRGSGTAWNAILREGIAAPPSVARQLRSLETALRRATAPRDLVVLRAASTAEVAAYGRTGAAGRLRAFLSTTISPEVADGFATMRQGVVMEVRVRAGAGGAGYIHNIPEARPEQFELLLAPGLRYRVVSRTKRRIVLEVGGE